MGAIIGSISVLLFGTALLLVGGGLQGSLIALRAAIEGFDTPLIGLIMAGYFIGFVLGSRYSSQLIRSAGHIRVFAALASIASAAALLHILYTDPWSWWVLRVITGFCFAGLYMVIESWLNDRANNTNRGSILSVYMVISLIALALGQQFLGLADPASFELFVIVSVLISFALVPIALTRTAAPLPVTSQSLGIRLLFRVTPLGAVACLASGLVSGAFWGMGPLYADGIGLDTAGVGNFMSVFILGGVVMQWPIGWLSDRFGRYPLILFTSLALAASSTLLYSFTLQSLWLLYLVAALTGGALFPLYSLAIAHANDLLEADNRLAGASSLLLLYGIGASLGPLLSGLVMGWIGPAGLYAFCTIVALLLILYTFSVRGSFAAIEEEAHYVPSVLTTPEAILLDPRVEQESVDAMEVEAAVNAGKACTIEEGAEGENGQPV